MDRITASMCERAYRRASFARVLIEVDADKELVDSVEVCYASLGKSMKLRVEYAWKPPQCLQCKVFGHDHKTCSKSEVAVEERIVKAKENIDNNVKLNTGNMGDKGWQEVKKFANNGASTSRNEGQQNFGYYMNKGGSTSRGRGGYMGKGGMMGRGGMVQRSGKEGNNLKNVTLENNGKKVDDGIIFNSNIKNDNKGKGLSVSKVELKSSISKQNDINTKNSFDVLAKDISYGHTNIAMQAKLKANGFK
ncbi:hypothetical protein CTI12_AA374850 [Artemisia annua]|uniref:Zinc knuckle CX2CX4HX4C n=1 Tax=Artemisia annua TaxID=35608 RepID=A0A2U1MK84_ARTAN|nr:hypothetical protein CTI12_AA374850 [Artemisia annua]